MSAPLLTSVGLPMLISGIREALKNISHPAAKGASAALGSLNDAISRGQITPEQMAEMNRHVEKLEQMDADERAKIISEVNQSLRAEAQSNDAYVRRMRPTFGYLIALTWAAQMLALAYVIVFETPQASLVLQAMESLGTIWAVGLSVLGIYVYKRSEDKKINAQDILQNRLKSSVSATVSSTQAQKFNP
jgi:hypothetical protein